MQCCVCQTGIVEDRVIELSGQSYHGACFACVVGCVVLLVVFCTGFLFQSCGKNLIDKVTFADDDGNILCFDCHMKKTNKS